MFKDGIESDKLRKLFLSYLCGSDRPIHEVLFPTPKDIKEVFENEFQGMTIGAVGLKQLEEARDQLLKWVYKTLTDAEKEFLLSFVELNPDYSKLGVSGAEKFPSILWKQINLSKLKDSNSKKFAQQSSDLKSRFDKM